MTARFRLLLPLLLAAACNPVPTIRAEAGPADAAAGADSDGAGGRITVVWDRSFGAEGERPAHLMAGKTGHLWAVSDRAVYGLASDGRVLSRAALPTSQSGAYPVVASATWDGHSPALVLRWPGLSAQTNPWSLLRVSPPMAHGAGHTIASGCLNALGRARGSQNMVLYEQVQGSQKEARLMLADLTLIAGGGKPSTALLQTGLPLTASVGDWGVQASGGTFFCATLPGGQSALWAQADGHKPNAYTKTTVHAGSRPALGRCRAVSSGRTHLAAYMVQAKPYAELDLGPGAPDMGVKGIGYDEPTARVVPPTGGGAPSTPLRLGHLGGILSVQDLLWDGARYLVLVNAEGQRGGRLLLTALDEAGGLLARDLEIPLAYEPGRLLAARLLPRSGGGYTLLYASRRPWDAGVLHLARVSVSW